MGLADKVKQTQASFHGAEPQAVARCPQVEPVAEPEPEPAKVAVAKPGKAVVPPVEEKPKKKSWIEIMLVDMEGKPMPGVLYRITPPGGGAPQEGTLNEFGQAGYYQIEPGTCKITFPDLDQDAWD